MLKKISIRNSKTYNEYIECKNENELANKHYLSRKGIDRIILEQSKKK
ncbi:hypothetical protein [Clostridium sp. D53t1_180928_C8]|nr:hypothetical protein [Clostridium sp. D53t1_180928_C8]